MPARVFVLTDLEGVVGVDSWTQTKRDAEGFDPDAEAAAMDELAREVNACIEGIRGSTRTPRSTCSTATAAGGSEPRTSGVASTCA